MSTLPLLLTLAVAADPTHRIVDLRTGEDVSVSTLVEAVADCDVLFLGEEHDNPDGHRVHHEIVERLQAKRPNLAISLEMFERDVQGVVDDYVRDRIDEAAFLERSRPWGEYDAHYRPFVEFARRKNLDVIAGNVPRSSAGKVARGEKTTLAESQFLPRTTTAPNDAYRELFAEQMESHVGTDQADALQRYYAAQCLKDDAMAEAITDHLATRRGDRPCIVHVAGTFHVDHGFGTVQRVLTRRPLLRTVVVSMESVDEVSKFEPKSNDPRGHYLVVVSKPESDDEQPSGDDTPAEAEDG